MSIFDSRLELSLLFDELVEGFVKKGETLEWIQESVSEGISFAIEDYKNANGIDEE